MQLQKIKARPFLMVCSISLGILDFFSPSVRGDPVLPPFHLALLTKFFSDDSKQYVMLPSLERPVVPLPSLPAFLRVRCFIFTNPRLFSLPSRDSIGLSFFDG